MALLLLSGRRAARRQTEGVGTRNACVECRSIISVDICSSSTPIMGKEEVTEVGLLTPFDTAVFIYLQRGNKLILANQRDRPRKSKRAKWPHPFTTTFLLG